MSDPPRLLRLSETAGRLGLPVATLRRYLAAGVVRGYQPGGPRGHYRFFERDLVTLLDAITASRRLPCGTTRGNTPHRPVTRRTRQGPERAQGSVGHTRTGPAADSFRKAR